jgi:hypothetical protein
MDPAAQRRTQWDAKDAAATWARRRSVRLMQMPAPRAAGGHEEAAIRLLERARLGRCCRPSPASECSAGACARAAHHGHDGGVLVTAVVVALNLRAGGLL